MNTQTDQKTKFKTTPRNPKAKKSAANGSENSNWEAEKAVPE